MPNLWLDQDGSAGSPGLPWSDDSDYTPLATPVDAEREWLWNVGGMRPQCAWLCSDRDVWYANPFYRGPAVPHPESTGDYFDLPDLEG